MQTQTKVRTIKSLMRDMKKGNYNLNHIVQRQAEQWNKQEKELLIDSIVRGITLFPIVFCVVNDELFIIDGKQRISIIYDFIENENSSIKYQEKRFEELDDDTKDIILSTEITTFTYSNCSDEDVFMIFRRYNNGISLSGSQKNRGYASPTILLKIKDILSSSFFDKCNITKGQKLKGEDETVILQTCILLSGYDFKNFSFKEIERFLMEEEEQEILGYLDEIQSNVNVLDKLVKEKTKYLKKIHLPMILSSVTKPYFEDKLNEFLTNYENLNDYRSHCSTGTSQKEHVLGRLEYWNN